MTGEFSRTELLIGKAAVKKLAKCRVAVFGIGGVGGYAVEALVRSGIGAIDLIDNDTVSLSNLNRQILATHQTLGKNKVDVASKRITDINPNVAVFKHQCFYLPENADMFDFSAYDYVIDAVDTVTAKLSIITEAKRAGVPVISCMGAGNKLDPTLFRVADIYKTKVCPLAKVMRNECKKRGIKNLKVVYSEELPIHPAKSDEEKGASGRPAPGSIAFVPSVAGLILAGEVIKDLIKPASPDYNKSDQ